MEDKPPYTPEEDEDIREALAVGASTAQDICFETGLDYMKIMEWFGHGDNTKEAERLSQQPLWDAKKKVLGGGKEDTATAKWLLTHHKETKRDWGDRIEHDVEGELKLKDLSDEELKERAAEIMSKVLGK